MPDAVVVGAGVAGLLASRALAAAGAKVVLLDAADRPGGQLDEAVLAGVPLDVGAESFATRGGAVAALAAALGLEVVSPSPAPAWVVDPAVRGPRRAFPLPAAAMFGVPVRPLAADVVRAIGVPAALRASFDRLLPRRVGAGVTTVGELVAARMGVAVRDRLVAPVVRGVYSAGPESVELLRVAPGLLPALAEHGSLAAAVATLRARSPAGSQVQGIRGGVTRLVAALVTELERAGVELRLGARVREVGVGRVVLDGGETLSGEVVVAAPDLGPTPQRRRELTVVAIAVDAPELAAGPRGSGVLVARGSGSSVAARALTHSSAKWPWLAELAGEHQLLRLSYDGRPALDDTELVAQAERDAAALTGARIRGVEAAAVRHWSRPVPDAAAPPGVRAVGEAGSVSGLAAIVAEAAQCLGHVAPQRPCASAQQNGRGAREAAEQRNGSR